MSCWWHGYPWPSLATPPYRSSPQAGLQDNIPYPHIAAECMFVLVILLLHGHVWGSIRVHLLWVRNKHIIVYLIEVLVSYIPKFNVLHTALHVHCWNCSRDIFNVSSSLSLVERGKDMSLISRANALEASGLLVWKTVPINYICHTCLLESEVNHERKATYLVI